jgi:hypothetical protein
MTDLQQADSKPISAKKITITLLATAIFGSIVGLAAWSLLLTTSQAIAVVSIGRYDQTPYSLIEEPQAVIERIKSPNFVAAASARAGISELSTLLSTLLSARQYGGSGALTARSLRDVNLIEIRINLTQPELALKATTAVVDELIADHEAKTAPLIQNLQSALTVLEGHASEMIEASDTITKRVSGSSQNEEVAQNSTALLSARALTASGLAALVKNESELRGLLSNIRKTQVVASPTVTTPKPTSLYQTVAAGTLAGLLAGLLLLQMFPGFFRTGRPRLGISRPDPV